MKGIKQFIAIQILGLSISTPSPLNLDLDKTQQLGRIKYRLCSYKYKWSISCCFDKYYCNSSQKREKMKGFFSKKLTTQTRIFN